MNNNPGMDMEIWKQLRKKWTDLDASGHKVKVDFKAVADPNDNKRFIIVDVVQHIDGELVTETVQRNAGEAYASLGIAGLSMEELIVAYKKIMKQVHSQAQQRDADLIVTMSPHSPTSGELRGYLMKPNTSEKTSVQVNYRHYYVLNALREKMIETIGESWRQVKTVYRSDALEFYFEYL